MVWMLTTEMTPKVGNGIAPSLRSRDYKDPPLVIWEMTDEDELHTDRQTERVQGETPSRS